MEGRAPRPGRAGHLRVEFTSLDLQTSLSELEGLGEYLGHVNPVIIQMGKQVWRRERVGPGHTVKTQKNQWERLGSSEHPWYPRTIRCDKSQLLFSSPFSHPPLSIF